VIGTKPPLTLNDVLSLSAQSGQIFYVSKRELMKINIDFSIFCSTTSTYGYVTGLLDFNEIPRIGETVKLFDIENQIDEFDGALKVESFVSDHNVLGFEPVVLSSLIMADSLAEELETKYGLFVVRYDEQ